jgi:hypothetical protein
MNALSTAYELNETPHYYIFFLLHRPIEKVKLMRHIVAFFLWRGRGGGWMNFLLTYTQTSRITISSTKLRSLIHYSSLGEFWQCYARFGPCSGHRRMAELCPVAPCQQRPQDWPTVHRGSLPNAQSIPCGSANFKKAYSRLANQAIPHISWNLQFITALPRARLCT